MSTSAERKVIVLFENRTIYIEASSTSAERKVIIPFEDRTVYVEKTDRDQRTVYAS